MNRKERRASHKHNSPRASTVLGTDWDKAFNSDDLMAKARWHHQQCQPEMARDICNRILSREPLHVPAMNLLGLIFQGTGRHRVAVKEFARAIALDDCNAACHYNLATSYQALHRNKDAAVHFRKAISLGLSQKNIEGFIFQNPSVAACISRIDEKWPLPVKINDVFRQDDLRSIANDIFLRCALEAVLVRTESLERFLTLIRSALLFIAHQDAAGFTAVDDAIVCLQSAIAQQCFINEYVFAQSDEETGHSGELQRLLLQRLADGEEISPLLLAAVSAYAPLHSLPRAEALLDRHWPDSVAGLVRLQLEEPLEEEEYIKAIAALTPVDDLVSLKVMQQYAENPYPRWTINPIAAFATEWEMSVDEAGNGAAAEDILIAGCGTGQHVLQVAQRFPKARVLAVDISRPSIAYAQRKTREEGFDNIEYAQADILRLAATGRSFDRIEAVGVLHHLAEPELGWRCLLSLLRPSGEMRVGLYSEEARRDVVAVRAFIAERSYRPSVEDIRRCRQAVFRDFDKQRWNGIIEASDFYSTSGCRDLLFHVMEHRFTIPKIKAFLDEQQFTFQGFDLEASVLRKFRNQFPDEADFVDLDKWHTFEIANPRTFRKMYLFTVRKD